MKILKKTAVLSIVVSSFFVCPSASFDVKLDRYMLANNDSELKNFFTDKIDPSKISLSGLKRVEDPLIRSYLNYDGNEYYYTGHECVERLESKIGTRSFGYVSTYVLSGPDVDIERVTSPVYGKYISTISYDEEIMDSFEIESSVSSTIGAGVEVYGFGARAGIKSYFSNSFGSGSGSSFGVHYELNYIKPDKMYYIRKTTSTYRFISIVDVAGFDAKFQSTHTRHIYLTNSINNIHYQIIEA